MEQTLRADARRNREKVLLSAAELFAAGGLSVSVQEIARHAGVGVGTVGRHFATKEALWEAILEDGIARLVRRGDELAATMSAGDAFFEYFAESVRAGAANRGLAERLATTSVGREGPGEKPMSVGTQALCDQLEDLLTAAQAVGAVRASLTLGDVEALMVACMSREDSLEPIMTAVLAGLRTE